MKWACRKICSFKNIFSEIIKASHCIMKTSNSCNFLQLKKFSIEKFCINRTEIGFSLFLPFWNPLFNFAQRLAVFVVEVFASYFGDKCSLIVWALVCFWSGSAWKSHGIRHFPKMLIDNLKTCFLQLHVLLVKFNKIYSFESWTG